MKRMTISTLAAVAVFSACAAQLAWGEFATNTTAETETQLVAPSEELRVAEAVSSVRVFRLELHSEVDGTERCFVVGVDGVKRPLVLVDPDEYSILTGRLESVWQSFHSTPDGRRKLHGKIERTEISEANGMVTKTEIHADGYTYRTAAVPKREKRKVEVAKIKAKISDERKPLGMSDKQWEVRRALKRIKNGEKKTVTVEHDAVSGKDTVVK